jgi:hypothetical protein
MLLAVSSVVWIAVIVVVVLFVGWLLIGHRLGRDVDDLK